jgi:hypothetical protein
MLALGDELTVYIAEEEAKAWQERKTVAIPKNSSK